MTGRILSIEKVVSQSGFSIKGQAGRSYYRTPFGYCNGAGMMCSYPETHWWMKASVYTPNGNRTVDINIDSQIQELKESQGWDKISPKRLQTLKSKYEGTKSSAFTPHGYDFSFDESLIL